jgi:uncharacterized phage-associated protein
MLRVIKNIYKKITKLYNRNERCDNMKTVNALELSPYIIFYLKRKNISVNHLKLQKLIYYADAWHYVFNNSPLIKEHFEAWQHGPVVRNVWDYYKDKSILYNPIPAPKKANLLVTEDQIQIINDVLDEYGKKTAYYLECLTHEEEPWKRARSKANKIIEKNHMKQFYVSLIDNASKKETA